MGLILERPDFYEQCLANAIELAPDHPQNHIILGHIKASRFRIEQAVVHYNDAIQIDQSRADAYNLRASANRKLGNVTAAIADLDNAIARSPVDPAGCHFKMAECYAAVNNRSAARAIAKGMAIDPNHPCAALAANLL